MTSDRQTMMGVMVPSGGSRETRRGLRRREARPQVLEHAADGGDHRATAEVDRAAGEDLGARRRLVVGHLGREARAVEVGNVGEDDRSGRGDGRRLVYLDPVAAQLLPEDGTVA